MSEAWKLVPVEATSQMFAAFIKATFELPEEAMGGMPPHAFESFQSDYRAMLAAVPSPSVGETEKAAGWNEAIERAAKVLDDAAQDWNRIRDPGMANNARSYAKRIRALKREASPEAVRVENHVAGSLCKQAEPRSSTETDLATRLRAGIAQFFPSNSIGFADEDKALFVSAVTEAAEVMETTFVDHAQYVWGITIDECERLAEAEKAACTSHFGIVMAGRLARKFRAMKTKAVEERAPSSATGSATQFSPSPFPATGVSEKIPSEEEIARVIAGYMNHRQDFEPVLNAARAVLALLAPSLKTEGQGEEWRVPKIKKYQPDYDTKPLPNPPGEE